MPDYSDSQVIQRMDGGPDAKRKATYDQWLQQAKAGDQTALRKLYLQADPDGPGGYGAGTRDSRNYLRLILRDQGDLLTSQGFDPSKIGGYMEQGDAQFNLGKTLGSVLKVAAPIAGMAIPGLGFAGAAALGAGGSAAGGMLHGDKFNLKDTLLAGGAAGLGNKALGNGLGSGSSNWGFGSSGGGISGGGAGGMEGMAPSPIEGGAGHGGFLDKLWGGAKGFLGGGDGFGFDDILKVGGTIGAIDSQHHANQMQDQAIQGATNEWNSRQPLRDTAMQGIQGLSNFKAPDMSDVFADPNNPYYRKPKPLGVG